ncbi:MAG: hypothetical protein QM640_09615, partial [Niabella sp.]
LMYAVYKKQEKYDKDYLQKQNAEVQEVLNEKNLLVLNTESIGSRGLFPAGITISGVLGTSTFEHLLTPDLFSAFL